MAEAREGLGAVLAARDPAAFGEDSSWLALVQALREEGAQVEVWAADIRPALARLLERAGSRIERLDWPGDGLFSQVFRVRRLAARLQAARVTLFHLFGCSGGPTLLAAARRAGSRTVLAPDRLSPPSPHHRRHLTALGRLFALADALEVPSEAARDRLSALFPECAARIRIVPPGLDIATRAPERVGGLRIAALIERFQLDSGRRHVLVCGPFSREGPPLWALRAMATCQRGDFDLLLCSGNATDHAFLVELQALLRATGLEARVRFLPLDEDRAATFALADLVLHLPPPDVVDPLPFIEAQAAGVPVVTEARRGFEEFLLPGVTGWLVPQGDREALAAVFATALSLDPAARDRIAARCRQFASETFSLARSLRARLQLYRSLVAALPHGSRTGEPAGFAGSVGQ